MTTIILLAFFAIPQAWATLTADSIAKSTTITAGAKYVIGTGSYFVAATSNGWGSAVSISSAYRFTAYGATNGFYAVGPDGRLTTASAKSWSEYDHNTGNNIRLDASGNIIASTSSTVTSPVLKSNGNSSNKFRWYASGQNAVYFYQIGYNVLFTQPASGSIAATSTTAVYDATNSIMPAVFATRTITLTATPPSGKTVNAWTVKRKSNNSDVTTTVLSGTTLTMPAYDVVVSVTWKDAAACAVNPSVSGSGNGSFLIPNFSPRLHRINLDVFPIHYRSILVR